jgi:amidohydrolase
MPLSTDRLLAALLAGIERQLPAAVELRHRLHSAPELAHAERLTAETVTAALPVAASVAADTGRIALVGPAHGRAVAIRAELDGLPLRERTEAPFSSRGETMHACGHDVHMAALVAVVCAAQAIATELPAPLIALFQPSEEAYPSGAQQLAEGELAGMGVAAVLGVHVHPELPWESLSLDAGTVNASCDAIEIVVQGEPTHGAYPHHGRDAVLALAETVLAIHARAGRVLDPMVPGSVTIGVLEAGSAENLIPGAARARGALRAHRQSDRERLREMVREVAEGVAAAHGCSARVELQAGEPALENDAGIVAAARELLPQAGLSSATPWRSCGSDDFAFFSALAPLVMAFLGLRDGPGFRERPLHHPELLVPDEAVGAVARAQAVLYAAAAACVRG